MVRGRPPQNEPGTMVNRNFNLKKALYEELKRIAAKERRDVTSQVTLALEAFVAEYQRRETEPGNWVPAQPVTEAIAP